jgi:hypothetical protein
MQACIHTKLHIAMLWHRYYALLVLLLLHVPFVGCVALLVLLRLLLQVQHCKTHVAAAAVALIA